MIWIAFLGTLLSAFSNNRAISYITAKFVNESLLQMENERTGDTVHTALGLYTELVSFVIGSLSVNRLLYPDAEFSTYRTAPKATWPQKKTEVYYMAGSAAGCGSASAFMPGGDDKNFAVTVLSNTSGPVDPSDHILRLILRRLANVKERKAGTALHINRPVSVAEHVKNACRTSFSEWERMDAEVRELEKARILPFDISGTFAGRGLSQRLIIDSKADGEAVHHLRWLLVLRQDLSGLLG